MNKWNRAKRKAAVWWTQSPASIKAAIFFLSAFWVIHALFLASLQRTIPAPAWRHPFITGLIIEATLVAQLGFDLYVIALIGRKRAIGRLIVLLEFVAFSALRFIYAIKLRIDVGTTIFLVLGVVSALLFTRESRDWFRSKGEHLTISRNEHIFPIIENTKKIPAMKFNLRESVPILNSDTPITIKIAALIFLISYSMTLHSLVIMIYGEYLFYVGHVPDYLKTSASSIRSIEIFTVAALAMWALMKGFLIVKILFRRRWAKNVLSAIAVIMFIVIFWTHSMHPENESLSLRNNFDCIAEVVAVVLLSTPRSAAWFRFRA